MDVNELLASIGFDLSAFSGSDLSVTSPIDGSEIACLRLDSPSAIEQKVERSVQAFSVWRDVPAPKRGELVRLFAEELRANKEALARLVTIENGKILDEGRGEVQEMIDISDLAVGLSRQLFGLTIASERPKHLMQENWLPLGPVGCITAFNFPTSVWAWNAAIALVCGDTMLWKPSDKTPLTALATQAIFEKAARRHGGVPEGVSQVLIGGRATVGAALVNDPRVPLISATGSTKMGRAIGAKVAERFGRCILELGGNNAVIVGRSADLDVALPSLLFGAVGTAGQRCTSTRRIIAHESVVDEVFGRLKQAYLDIAKGRVGDPLDPGALVGPLIDKAAFENMQAALEAARPDAAEVVGGGRLLADRYPNGYYAAPALVRMPRQTDVVMSETFAPLAYVMSYRTIEEALELNNAAPQGLSSAIMTTDFREVEFFRRNSDCGIANVNIGTSGAEIGGAFGGEKETGGGREAGSDAWKGYMRRQTSTAYYGTEKPALAQGVRFEAS